MKKMLICISIFLLGMISGIASNRFFLNQNNLLSETHTNTTMIESSTCPYEVEAVLFSNLSIDGIICTAYSYTDEDGHIGTFLVDEYGHSLLLNKIMYNGANNNFIYLTQELFIVPSKRGFNISWLKMSL